MPREFNVTQDRVWAAEWEAEPPPGPCGWGFRSRKDQTLGWGGGTAQQGVEAHPSRRSTALSEQRSPWLWKSPPAPVPTFCKRLQTPDVPKEPFPPPANLSGVCTNCSPLCQRLPAPGSGSRTWQRAESPEELRATPPPSHPGQTDGGSPPVWGGRQALGLSALLWSKIPRDSHLQPSAATEAFSPRNALGPSPHSPPMTSAASRDLTPATGCAMLKSRN